mmetsp:Transcript_42711/g.66907  ORF Transcript_42711/g.66907 Transcript_42711/m.66907 type:complete len:116 (+) Transcript_42711:207-554(+)
MSAAPRVSAAATLDLPLPRVLCEDSEVLVKTLWLSLPFPSTYLAAALGRSCCFGQSAILADSSINCRRSFMDLNSQGSGRSVVGSLGMQDAVQGPTRDPEWGADDLVWDSEGCSG